MNALTENTHAEKLFDAQTLEKLREDFPILGRPLRNKRLVYLDNAATTQKPQAVIETEARFYRESNANIHRGVHQLSQRATDAYEAARKIVRSFLNAAHEEEIIFVRGTTEAINLVAQCYGRPRLRPGDEILLTTLEHHSNIVPWQMVAEQTGAIIKVVPIDADGALDMAAFGELLGERTRIVAVGHASNALGTVNPVAEIVARAHAVGAVVLLDGAQAVAHVEVDVQALDCDFYAFSGHKLYGPTGIGALYGRRELLRAMPPWQGGGDMIRTVRFSGTEYADPPARFEAGTPNIAGAITLAASIDYVLALGLKRIAAHEAALLRLTTEALREIPGLRCIGTAPEKTAIVSFELQGAHPHDVGTILDHHGIAIRAGHHCAMPLMEHLGLTGTARASFALYNGPDDVEALVAGLHIVNRMFKR